MTIRPPRGGHGPRPPRRRVERAHRPPVRARLLVGGAPGSFSLSELCSGCAVLVGSAGASLQLAAAGTTTVAESSDRGAARASDVQATLGEGPTVDSLRLHRAVPVAHLADDPRWPELAAEAPRLGYHAALAVPLRFERTQLGVLTAYYTEPTDIDGGAVAHASHVARVTLGVLLALPVEVADGLARAISTAADHQARIHQAAGIISAREGCSIEEAMVRIRAHAYASDRLLGEVAEAVVTTGLRLP